MKGAHVVLVLLLSQNKPETKPGEPLINSKGSSQAYRSNYDRIFKDQKAN